MSAFSQSSLGILLACTTMLILGLNLFMQVYNPRLTTGTGSHPPPQPRIITDPKDHSHLLWSIMKQQRNQLIKKARLNCDNLLNRGKLIKLYRPTFTCPYEMLRLGTPPENGDGGKWVCGVKQLFGKHTKNKCVVYSLGVGRDSSFEADIKRLTRCKIFAYDHTVNSTNPPVKPGKRVKFTKLGLADKKTLSDPRFSTLTNIMKRNGHRWIDILKMDVEGAEWDGLNMLMEDWEELPVGQLQVEIHAYFDKEKDKGKQYSVAIPWFDKLEEKGMRIFYAEPNPYDPGSDKIDCSDKDHNLRQYEYAFINVKAAEFRNSSFTFEKLLLGSAINTFYHY